MFDCCLFFISNHYPITVLCHDDGFWYFELYIRIQKVSNIIFVVPYGSSIIFNANIQFLLLITVYFEYNKCLPFLIPHCDDDVAVMMVVVLWCDWKYVDDGAVMVYYDVNGVVIMILLWLWCHDNGDWQYIDDGVVMM